MKPQFLDKFGAAGACLTALACPVCFPLLALASSALGLGFLQPYEGFLMYVFKGLVVVAFVGNVLAYLNHKQLLPCVVGVVSAGLIFFAFYVRFSAILLYAGLAGLVLAAILNTVAKRRCSSCRVT